MSQGCRSGLPLGACCRSLAAARGEGRLYSFQMLIASLWLQREQPDCSSSVLFTSFFLLHQTDNLICLREPFENVSSVTSSCWQQLDWDTRIGKADPISSGWTWHGSMQQHLSNLPSSLPLALFEHSGLFLTARDIIKNEKNSQSSCS